MGRRVYATAAAELGSGSLGGVRLCALVLSSATLRPCAMPRGLRHSEPICFGAVWRGARRCGRSRVGWVGGSEIGLEDLRGFVGVLGSPCAPRRRVVLIERASAELSNTVCAPTDT